MSDICQVCGGHEAMPMVHQEPHLWVRCPDCNFAWISPMPDPAEQSAEERDAIARACIAADVAKIDSKMRRSRRRVRRLARRMPGKRLLDIGSSIGFMVAAAMERGLDATGIDSNPLLVEEARRRYPQGRFILGTFEEADLPAAAFDGVCCSEVIGHIPDSNRFLSALARVMKPDAVLFLTTPALREYTRGTEPGRWRRFGGPEHKLYFSPANIRTQLHKHGFSQVRVLFNYGRGIKLFAMRAG